MRTKNNRCAIPTSERIDQQKATYQDVHMWDDELEEELEEQMEREAAQAGREA